jgi:GNAT superfamily N-acetyltransferase
MKLISFLPLLLFFGSLHAELRVETFKGKEISSHIKEIRALCDTIYCESPYLHNGQDQGYDTYLENYAKSNQSIACIAYDDKKVVGMAAGMPMTEAHDVFKKPLDDQAHDLDAIFYLGEFGLRPEYRGKGLEEKMFSKIEAYARENGQYKRICFCEIDDVTTPTQKPPGTIMRDDFWKNHGFNKYSKVHFLVFWTNINETIESPHLAVFWTKKLSK